MALTKDQKKKMLDSVIDKFKQAKSVVFSGYTGINVKLMTGLRKQLKGQKIDYLIVKKTLLKIGAKEAKLPEIDEKMLEGPIAVAVSYDDEIAPMKILYGMSRDKNFEKKLELYGGIMEGKILSKEEVMTLATIPSKQELLSKLVYLMKSPVSGFHFVLHEVVRKFVGTMDALKSKKPAETVAADTVSDVPAAVAAEDGVAAPAEPTVAESDAAAPAEPAAAEGGVVASAEPAAAEGDAAAPAKPAAAESDAAASAEPAAAAAESAPAAEFVAQASENAEQTTSAPESNQSTN